MSRDVSCASCTGSIYHRVQLLQTRFKPTDNSSSDTINLTSTVKIMDIREGERQKGRAFKDYYGYSITEKNMTYKRNSFILLAANASIQLTQTYFIFSETSIKGVHYYFKHNVLIIMTMCYYESRLISILEFGLK